MPTFTPRQLLFRRLERLWIGASLTEGAYTITRVDNNLYSVTRGRHCIELRDTRANSVSASIERVITYCMTTPHGQSIIRNRQAKQTRGNTNAVA